jgi:hypothetical protein
MAFAAELRTETPDAEDFEPRGTGRHKLNLGVCASAGPNVVQVLIHNISASGMLLESSAVLAQQDGIDVDIPEAGTVQASVVWVSDNLYGCQFVQPLSRAALSAAILRSPRNDADARPAPSPSVDLEALSPLEADTPSDPHAYSTRAKLAIIGGLATLAWIPLLVLVWLMA